MTQEPEARAAEQPRNQAAKIRAVVLAAGRGQRLRPLTDEIPKPLLPVGERVILERTLSELAQAGVEAVALNLHHLGDKIRGYLGDTFADMPVVYSEEAELLGTLGALAQLQEFLEPAELAVVINGDSLCQWPIAAVIEHHRSTEALATLLVSSFADPVRFGGGIGVENGYVRGFLQPAPGEARVFAGLQVFDPKILQGLAVKRCDTVRDLYQPALDRGQVIAAYTADRPWFDLGTPSRYLDGVLATCQREGSSPVSAQAEVPESAEIVDSVVLAGARLGEHTRLSRVVVGPGVELASDTMYSSAMLTRPDSANPDRICVTLL